METLVRAYERLAATRPLVEIVKSVHPTMNVTVIANDEFAHILDTDGNVTHRFGAEFAEVQHASGEEDLKRRIAAIRDDMNTLEYAFFTDKDIWIDEEILYCDVTTGRGNAVKAGAIAERLGYNVKYV